VVFPGGATYWFTSTTASVRVTLEPPKPGLEK
jgi:hypothetical protein